MAGNPLPESLRIEGLAMLTSVVEDLSRIPGLQVISMLDERLLGSALRAKSVAVRPGEEKNLFQRLASEADRALIIAPEFDGILLDRSRWAEESGIQRIGPTLEAIELTSNKLALARHLLALGVSAAGGRVVHPEEGLPGHEFSRPMVLKPLFGAGSQATFLIRSAAEAVTTAKTAVHDGLRRDALLQPYFPGQAVSVSFLMGPRAAVTLMPCSQRLSEDGRFRYLGGRTPLESNLAWRAVKLASKAVASVPGLRGYVGVDLVLGASEPEDVIMEINPRLTTSYVGLRALSAANLAETLLSVFQGQDAPPVPWNQGPITFTSDGRTSRRPVTSGEPM